MRKLIIITAAVMLTVNGFGQITFEKNIDSIVYHTGEYSIYDFSCVQQTAAGGYILAGNYKNNSILLLKTNQNGDTLWLKSYSGSGTVNSVKQTTDGGYFLTGSTTSFGAGNSDVYLIKADSLGAVQWSKTIGGAADDYGNYGEQTTDGGYIITGTTGSFGGGAYLIKTNINGDTTWTKIYENATANYVKQTSDNGYITTGAKNNGTYLLKTNSMGDTLWSKVYISAGGILSGYGSSVQQTLDGGYIIAGTSPAYSIDDNAATLIKTDSLGNVTWSQYNFNSSFWEHDSGYLAQQTSDGGYMWGLVSYLNGTGTVSFIKTNSSGINLWGTEFEEAESLSTSSFQQTMDSGYVFICPEDYNGIISFMKTDSHGNTSCNNSSLGGSFNTLPFQVYHYPTIISSGGIVTTPATIVKRPGVSDSTFCTTSTAGIATISNPETLSIYPNPTTTSFTISTTGSKIKEVKVFDVVGSLVISHLSSGNTNETIDMSSVSKGIYFVQILDEKQNVVNKKVVVQ